MRIPRCASVSLGTALVAVLGFTAPAAAQYFGRVPVQWEHLKFQVLKTDHFDVYFYPEGRQAAEQAGRMAERWYARLSRILGHEFKDRQPLILYASHPHFQQTNTVGGPPGEGTGGVTEAFKRRIVLPVGASLEETDHVLGHELVHAFQYAMTGQGKVSDTNFPSALQMPLWFIEGMAEYLSVGPVDPHTAMWLRDAARRDKGLPTISKLGSTRYFPYRYGQALWGFLAGRYGDHVFGDALRKIGPRSNDAELVLKAVTGVDSETLSKDWHAAIRNDFAPVVAGKKDPPDYGAALVTEKRQGGRLNVGPALNPEGTRLAFLSEREMFSVELFLQDVRTGDVTRQLSRTVTNPHLESLQFISSSGSFDRTGRHFALGAVARGRPSLLVIETEGGRKQREIPFPKLGEIYTPAFSPDGKSVVFSALVGGFTDLYVYDLEAGRLRRLTDDFYADLQPVWSPDGKTVAFATDRFSTDLKTLGAGNYRLAAVDVASGEIRRLPSFEKGKNINPQWSPDGKSLYFLSDRTGITNIYRLDVAGGELYQLTDLLGGVSGITALSPALSAAAGADRIAYSVYEDGKYEIYAIEGAEKLAGWAVGRDEPRYAGVIPGAKVGGAVLAARSDTTKGLAETSSFKTAPYKPKLGLDYIGQPYVAGGADRYGSFFAGGISMLFSDMLGNHTLYTAIEATRVSGFSDVGGLVGYVNRERRFNWGGQIYQVPYVVGGFSQGAAVQNGQPVVIQQTVTQRQLERGVLIQGYYPLDAALRVEAMTGFRNLGFETRVEQEVFSFRTGQLLSQERETIEGDSLNLYEGTLALVRDTSVFGPTSPVLGQRFRLDVTPVFGTVRYTGALADFRQYFMPVRPLTLAGRILHYGRYGSGGEDSRLYPLFLGYQSLVRGYDTGSFNIQECGDTTGGTCPVYDQLFGSRLLVGNVELRAPLLGLLGAKNMYGPLPIEIGAFFDAGVAWDSSTKPSLFGGSKELVKGAGATARLNLLGFAVLQLDWVKPLDRPGKGAFFQFNLLAGF
jgi:WD40 repeat protein